MTTRTAATTNPANDPTITYVSIVTASSPTKPIITSRGPRLSPRCPAGSPTSNPAAPAIVNPIPTCAPLNPTNRVKYNTTDVESSPLPIVLISVDRLNARSSALSRSIRMLDQF